MWFTIGLRAIGHDGSERQRNAGSRQRRNGIVSCESRSRLPCRLKLSLRRPLLIGFGTLALLFGQTNRYRARDLGIAPGVFPAGALNAITDAAGVRVGHRTLIEGDSIRTGVTAIIPADGNLFQSKVAGAVFVEKLLASWPDPHRWRNSAPSKRPSCLRIL